MRIEQIIAAVTRTLVNAIVREIRGVVSFVAALRLHLWQMRTSLGMPCYAGSITPSLRMDDSFDRAQCCSRGSKRGKQPGQPILATAKCQWSDARG